MIDAIIIASYFGIILLIGLRARRKVKGVSVNESKLVWYALFLSVALSLGLKWLVPDLAYFNRALLTIVLTFGVVAVPTVIQTDGASPCATLFKPLARTSDTVPLAWAFP